MHLFITESFWSSTSSKTIFKMFVKPQVCLIAFDSVCYVKTKHAVPKQRGQKQGEGLEAKEYIN